MLPAAAVTLPLGACAAPAKTTDIEAGFQLR